MIDNIHITISDMYPLYCGKGLRQGFNASGLDFKHFIEHGAMSHDLLGHGYDGIIERVVAAKKERENGQR